MFIPTNKYPYTPNTPNHGWPAQANRTQGRGFFNAPSRRYSGGLVRAVSPTFQDFYSQTRLFYNSLVPAEKQFLLNAIRFENSKVKSPVVRQNVVTQLNKVDNDLARRVAAVIGIPEPAPDPTYYHNNKTINVGTFDQPLRRLDGLKIGVLASDSAPASIQEATSLANSFKPAKVSTLVVAERLSQGVDQTYAASDATNFDAVIVANGAQSLFSPSSFTGPPDPKLPYPAGRPLQILVDAFRFGKTVGALGGGDGALQAAQINTTRPGVYVAPDANPNWVQNVQDGLRTMKFLDRFAVEFE